jgi:hypothetical protein
MSVDRTKIGKFALDAIDGILEDEDGEIEIGEMILVVNVRYPADEEHPYGDSHTRYWASDMIPHHQIGLLRTATLAAEGRS